MPTHIENVAAEEDAKYDNEKYSSNSDVSPALDEKDVIASPDKWQCPPEWVERLRDEYVRNHEGETLPTGADADRVIEAVMTFSPEEAVKKLEEAIDIHRRDLSFMQVTMERMRTYVQGDEAAGLDYEDWQYECCKLAGLIFNWSPYSEVRSVTLPYDDPEEPCETFRAYLLGFFWVIGCTIVNTCEYLRSSQRERS
jgi:hypothetical protein